MGCRVSAEEKADDTFLPVLLLGASEVGKSTLFRQLRFHNSRYAWTEEELRIFEIIVRSNIVTATCELCSLIREQGKEEWFQEEQKEPEEGDTAAVQLSPMDAFNEVTANLLRPVAPIDRSVVAKKVTNSSVIHSQNETKFRVYHHALAVLAKHPAFQRLCEMEVKNRPLVNDTTRLHQKVFLKEIDRIASDTYKPTENDIAHVRFRREKIEMVHLTRSQPNEADYYLYDISGGKADEQLCNHTTYQAFAQNGTTPLVVFVASLSDYNEYLSNGTNRMLRSMEIFQSFMKSLKSSSDTPHRSSILLIFNKKDAFEQKVKNCDISSQQAFKDYVGPKNDYQAGIEYFKGKFNPDSESTNNEFELEVISALDSQDITSVFNGLRRLANER